MAVTRTVFRVGADVNLIYSRVIGMDRNKPASMFAENGKMRIAKRKATLKKNLQVKTPSRLFPQPDIIIIDGCAILWVIQRPKRGTVRDFVDNFTSFIFGKAERCDTYLLIDRYHILASRVEHD